MCFVQIQAPNYHGHHGYCGGDSIRYSLAPILVATMQTLCNAAAPALVEALKQSSIPSWMDRWILMNGVLRVELRETGVSGACFVLVVLVSTRGTPFRGGDAWLPHRRLVTPSCTCISTSHLTSILHRMYMDSPSSVHPCVPCGLAAPGNLTHLSLSRLGRLGIAGRGSSYSPGAGYSRARASRDRTTIHLQRPGGPVRGPGPVASKRGRLAEGVHESGRKVVSTRALAEWLAY